jgi:hypothetical protein
MVITSIVQNGAWTDPTTWSTGARPGANDDVSVVGYRVKYYVEPSQITGASGVIQSLNMGYAGLSGTDLTVTNGVTFTTEIDQLDSGGGTVSLSGTLTTPLIQGILGATVLAQNVFATEMDNVHVGVSDGGLIRGALDGSTIYTTTAGGTFEFDGIVGSESRVDLGTSHLILDHPASLDLLGISTGSTVDLKGLIASSSSWNPAGTLEITLSGPGAGPEGVGSVSFKLTADVPSETPNMVPTVASDGHGGTLITFTLSQVAAPTNLADPAIQNGHVSVADDTAAQTLTGNAQANTVVAIIDTVAGVTLGATNVDAQGTWSFTLGQMAPGLHQLVALATDGVTTSPASDPLTFTVDYASLAPPSDLADAAIHNGYVNAAANVAAQTLTGDAAPYTVVAVIDAGVGAVVGSTYVDGSGTWSLPLGQLSDGVHQLYALDTDGTSVSPAGGPLTFTVDTAPPTPEVLFAAASGASYTLYGYTEPGGSVQLFDNGVQTTAPSVGADGVWSVTLALDPNTLHRFTEQATDAAGNVGISVGQTLFQPNASTLTGGAGQDVLIAWGNETLTGGGGQDRFVVDSNFTQRAITDFTPGTDVIELASATYHDFSTLSAHAQQSGANTVITVNGDVLTLQNVTLASLHASDFMFV